MLRLPSDTNLKVEIAVQGQCRAPDWSYFQFPKSVVIFVFPPVAREGENNAASGEKRAEGLLEWSSD